MLIHFTKGKYCSRVLAFSISRIVQVKVKVNEDMWKTCQHVKGPLYVMQWDPRYYQVGIHHVSVCQTMELLLLLFCCYFPASSECCCFLSLVHFLPVLSNLKNNNFWKIITSSITELDFHFSLIITILYDIFNCFTKPFLI